MAAGISSVSSTTLATPYVLRSASMLLPSGVRAINGSAIKALAFQVVEARLGDARHFDFAMHEHGDLFAHAAAAVFDQGHGNRALERRAHITGGNMSDHWHRRTRDARSILLQ